MKKIINILVIIFSLFTAFSVNADDYVPDGYRGNIPENQISNGQTNNDNYYIDPLRSDGDITIGDGEDNFRGLLYVIAMDVKSIMYIVAGVYFLLITIRLLVSGSSEEAAENWKKGVIWISLGIVVMQLAYYYVYILYSKDVNSGLMSDFYDYVIKNIIKFLETATSFVFVAIMIFAFYMMITSNGEEEKYKSGLKSVMYAFIGFILVKLSAKIVEAVYGKMSCNIVDLGILRIRGSCIMNPEIEGAVSIIAKIINWMNGFVGILVIIMIIYAGAQILLGNGDEEKLKKAKKSIIYIIIGIAILVMNYLILTFFVNPETPII